MAKVAIIGGGISGLAIGWELLSLGLPHDDLVIFEADAQAGGNMKTERSGSFVLETGPNGFLDNSPPTFDLVRSLGIEDRLLVSNEASAIRYLFCRGKLRKLPTGPGGMLVSGMLSLRGRMRVFMEPFIKKGGFKEESVFDFAARRIGKDAAETLVDAMVSGVFAGNARELELFAAFPKMAAMESEYGGLVKAMIGLSRKRKKEAAECLESSKKAAGPAGPGGTLTSFKNGFDELSRELAFRLGSSLRTGVRIKTLEKRAPHGYRIIDERGETCFSDTVVLAGPAFASSEIVGRLDPELSSVLGMIPSAGINVVATAYKLKDVGRRPNGFGFLVPRGHGVRILGCLWTSSIWDGRAPDDHVLLRTMVGGAHDPAAIEIDDQGLMALVAEDLKRTMGLAARPVERWIFRHEKGIAQYTPGHMARVERIEELLAGHFGVFVSGSSYGGISVNHCIAQAPGIASKVMRTVDSTYQSTGR